MPRPRLLSPVLLVGAGTGEAAYGVLYLASYLRRGGVEAFVRLYDGDESEDEVRRSLAGLVARVRPRLVGISLKWFHHAHRALLLARTLRAIDPTIRIVLGGNSATHWWRELSAYDCIDDVVLGDGERPLLALCRVESSVPNCVSGGRAPRRLTYVQGAANSDDVYYSHFNDIFLAEQDRHAFSGWIAPGKGCAESCLYCAGSRDNQLAAFGRAAPFLRSVERVRRDLAEVAPRTWQLRYDFPGSSAELLRRTWAGVDLSRHSCTYFLWGIGGREVIDALAETFAQVHVVFDVGCFSERQRRLLMRRGLLKPCVSDAGLLALAERCRRYPHLDLEVSGIAGLPYASDATLAEEQRLAQRLIAADCLIGYQRLEAQPGALVTEQPQRFEMQGEARTLDDFLRYLERRAPGDGSVPMLRFRDAGLDEAVEQGCERVAELGFSHRQARRRLRVTSRTRLVGTAPSTLRFTLADWLGAHRVPAGVAGEEVTVVRSVDGTSLVCAPSVSPRRFLEPTLSQGEEGRVLLAALAAFERPATVVAVVGGLAASEGLDSASAREVIDFLVEGRFLQRA